MYIKILVLAINLNIRSLQQKKKKKIVRSIKTIRWILFQIKEEIKIYQDKI